jgi:hypothetical protein
MTRKLSVSCGFSCAAKEDSIFWKGCKRSNEILVVSAFLINRQQKAYCYVIDDADLKNYNEMLKYQ